MRKLRNLTQGQVARQIGLAQDVYARYENDKRARGWPVSMLADVADALNVPLSALVPGERIVCDRCGGPVKGV